MNYIGLIILIIGLTFSSCKQINQKSLKADKQTVILDATGVLKDKEEIQKLIRQILIWSDSEESIDLLPTLTDSTDSIYTGFDMDKLNINLNKLKETNFFATEFIDNYNQIILTLDRKLRNKEYDEWFVGDLPTFIFVNDVNPWCLCQDNLSWNSAEVEVINLSADAGELEWNWGKLGVNIDPSWNEFSYKFRVIKEAGQWKVSYLEGFDFKESTRKDGEL